MITLGQLTAIMAALMTAVVIGAIWKFAPDVTTRLRSRWSLRPKLFRPKAREEPEESASETEISRRRRIGVVGGREEDDNEAEDSAIPVEIERELEHAFELYAQGRITLAAYREFVTTQKSNIERRLSEHVSSRSERDAGRDEPNPELTQLEAALDAVDWCLAWADTLGKPSSR